MTFFDANVLLEILLPDREYPEEAKQSILDSSNPVISPLTAHLYVHFGKKAKLPTSLMLEHIRAYNFTQMGESEIFWAIKNRQDDDFEDALQVACAVLNGCDQLVTFDRRLAGRYSRFIDIQLLG